MRGAPLAWLLLLQTPLPSCSHRASRHVRPHRRCVGASCSSQRAHHTRRLCARREGEGPPPSDEDFRALADRRDFEACYLLLKRNPMLSLDIKAFQTLLNNIDGVGTGGDEEKIEITSSIYKRFSRQKVLKGFGCIDGDYPEATSDISPAKLEEIAGIPISALTPKERTTYWRLAGIFLCLAEYGIGKTLGIDPLYTLIPLTFLVFLSDQIWLKGAGFESVYQRLFPEYRRKIVYHEAGHFLLAYLLGVPVRDCITSAWQARKNKEIKGQAGTVFYDTRVAEELSKQQISRSSINRLSVVIMAGVAAEANEFGRTEGGVADEQSLITFLNGVQPPWNILRIQGQARWAALQAMLIIREHKASYEALAQCLTEGGGIGDCVAAIEENLPATLPSVQRRLTREARRREQDRDRAVRYVEAMTRKAGGILGAADQAEGERGGDRDQVVTDFASKIRSLEQAVVKGDLNIPSNRGGVWLNGLEGPRNPNAEMFAPVNIVQSKEQMSAYSPADLLRSHRGYRMRQLEADEQQCAAKEEQIDSRLQSIKNSTLSLASFSAPEKTSLKI